MPELPEVETVCRDLNKILQLESKKMVKITSIEFLREDLRIKIPKQNIKQLIGQKLSPIYRRAKFLLFPTRAGSLLNHLGMTGYWREAQSLIKHDHLRLEFSNHKTLIYNDARRFGIIDYIKPREKNLSPWLKHLGVEPLSSEFSTEYLYSKLQQRKGLIKNVIMDQKLVVGVGNIYASETLFLAHLHPETSACRLSKKKVESLVHSIKVILQKAINHGGSTIRNYRSANGEAGNFSRELMVYNRKGQACKVCATPIEAKVLAGRSTYWCPQCQKKLDL